MTENYCILDESQNEYYICPENKKQDDLDYFNAYNDWARMKTKSCPDMPSFLVYVGTINNLLENLAFSNFKLKNQ